MDYNKALKMVIRDNLIKRIALKIANTANSPNPYLLSQAIAEHQLTEEECQKVLRRLCK